MTIPNKIKIPRISKFPYHGTREMTRVTENGIRHYFVNNEKLPSVTTILDRTKPLEERQKLWDWIKREGKERANQIKTRSANRGSTMHKILECMIKEENYADLTPNGQEATKMAEMIAERGLSNVSGWYGSEINIFYPGLYAGQTDLVGVHSGSDAIIDFKQTNKPKQREWINNYFLQMAAYAMAHDQVYGTQIKKGVIMMCSPDPYYQEFIIEGEELKQYKYKFLERLDIYHRNSYIDGRKETK